MSLNMWQDTLKGGAKKPELAKSGAYESTLIQMSPWMHVDAWCSSVLRGCSV